jgi:AcrR family transcriptional regulator
MDQEPRLPGLRRRGSGRGDRVTGSGSPDAPARPTRASYAEQARELLRERLLVAADDLLEDRDWAAITMADIAGGAGVSRQTLYNEFGSRQEFAQAYVLRETDRFIAILERAFADHAADRDAALAAALGGVLHEAVENALVRAIRAEAANGGLLALVTTRGTPVVSAATERMTAFFVTAWPQLPEARARIAADCATRLAISHILLPTGSPDDTAASIASMLTPYLARAF